MDELGREILERIRSLVPEGTEFDIPPPIVEDMEVSFRSFDPGRSLVLDVPLFPRYAGPTGMVQGGIIAAAFDDAYGPLAYLTAGAFAVTVTLDLSFVRPLPVSAGRMEVEVRVVERTRRLVFLEGSARNPEGKLVATSRTEMMVVDEPRRGGPGR